MTVDRAAQNVTQTDAPPLNPATPKWLAALGLFAGLGTVVASSCCVVPLGLAALGASATVLGGLEMVAEWRDPLLALSTLAIVGGWGAWFWKRPASCASSSARMSPQRSGTTLVLLLCATLIAMLAANWTHIDPVLLKMFRGR